MLLSHLDWNLLKALRALLEHQSVTEAAQAVGVTQSAMSHSLRRLRETFDDPILVNSAQGMKMTSRARDLQQALAQSLGPLEAALAAHQHFDPASSQDRIRILSHDYGETIMLPALLRALAERAPGLELDLVTGHRLDDHALAQGDVDLIIGADNPKAGHFRQRPLWQDQLVTVVSQDHPRISGDTVSLQDFAAEAHVFITKTGVQGGPMDNRLKEAGLSRHKRVVTRHFNAALVHVAASDMVVTLPWRVLNLSAHLPLKQITLIDEPKPEPWAVHMTWAPLTHEQPKMVWFRALLVEMAKTLPALPR